MSIVGAFSWNIANVASVELIRLYPEPEFVMHKLVAPGAEELKSTSWNIGQ